MRSLLTGYAGAVDRRHHRVGHLVQNCYKSIVGEEEPYLLELLRYLHLNPLRATIVADRRALDRYPSTGHRALVGRVPRPGQAAQPILAPFGPTNPRARRAYRAFTVNGISQGRRAEFRGGAVVGSLWGWAAVRAARRTGAAGPADARILGSGAFVAARLRAVPPVARLAGTARATLRTLAPRLAADLGVPVAALGGGSQTRAAVTARHLLAYVWLEVVGRLAGELARALGYPRGTIAAAARRGVGCAPRGVAAKRRWSRLQDVTERARPLKPWELFSILFDSTSRLADLYPSWVCGYDETVVCGSNPSKCRPSLHLELIGMLSSSSKRVVDRRGMSDRTTSRS